jgi:hypothetical protein
LGSGIYGVSALYWWWWSTSPQYLCNRFSDDRTGPLWLNLQAGDEV